MKPYYQDEWVEIYHGDCRGILPQLPKVDLVLTDPPYGINYRDNDWDKDVDLGWFELARTISPLVLFTIHPTMMWEYPKPNWVLCWVKIGAVQFSALNGYNHWTPILVYGKPKFGKDTLYLPSVSNLSNKYLDHPSPKPEALYCWLVENSSEPNHTILDPFLGSGTTAYCAKKLNRKCIGIEIEEKYCEIAANRCRQMVLDFAGVV